MQVLTTAPRLPHRYVKTKTFDMMERRQTLRKTYYQGFAGIDFFISVIWHAFLLWWTIQVRLDYHRDCTRDCEVVPLSLSDPYWCAEIATEIAPESTRLLACTRHGARAHHGLGRWRCRERSSAGGPSRLAARLGRPRGAHHQPLVDDDDPRRDCISQDP